MNIVDNLNFFIADLVKNLSWTLRGLYLYFNLGGSHFSQIDWNHAHAKIGVGEKAKVQRVSLSEQLWQWVNLLFLLSHNRPRVASSIRIGGLVRSSRKLQCLGSTACCRWIVLVAGQCSTNISLSENALCLTPSPASGHCHFSRLPTIP